MPKKIDMPPEGARLLAAVLVEVRPADVGMLRDLELDWPGSRALLARLGVALAAQDSQDARACLGKCLCTGLDAYRAARKARAGDHSGASPPSWPASRRRWRAPTGRHC